MYRNVVDNGYIKVEDSTSSVYRVDIKDFKGNTSELEIPIIGKAKVLEIEVDSSATEKRLIKNQETTTLKERNTQVTFYPNTVMTIF